MNVGQLIHNLKKLSPDALVLVDIQDHVASKTVSHLLTQSVVKGDDGFYYNADCCNEEQQFKAVYIS